MAKYIIRQKARGVKRFPLVMMLEPLHACNLTCTGCGRIREYEDTLKEVVPVEKCLAAAEECGAPMVAICGGEPLLYKEIGKLTRTLLERKKHVIVCTNGMFIAKQIGEFKPDIRFLWNVHLDGLKKSHDLAVEREGVFEQAVEGIKLAKSKGFRVMTNTTVYEETDMNEVEALLEYLKGLGVDSHVVSPGYSYSAVHTKEIFLDRRAIREKFKDIKRLARRYPIADSPVYLEFLAGNRGALLHGVGQSDLQHQGLERAVLSDHRPAPRQLQGIDRGYPVGALRTRPRPALRGLPGALRLRGQCGHRQRIYRHLEAACLVPFQLRQAIGWSWANRKRLLDGAIKVKVYI